MFYIKRNTKTLDIIKYISIYIYSSKHTLIRWCAAGSYAEAAGRAVPTSTLTDRKIILLN